MRFFCSKYIVVAFVLIVTIIKANAESVYRYTMPNKLTLELVLFDNSEYCIYATNRLEIIQMEHEDAHFEDLISEYAISVGTYSKMNDTICLSDNRWNCSLVFEQVSDSQLSCIKGFTFLENLIFEKTMDSYKGGVYMWADSHVYSIDNTCATCSLDVPFEFWNRDGCILSMKENSYWSISMDDWVILDGVWIRKDGGFELRNDKLKCSYIVQIISDYKVKLIGISKFWITPYFESKDRLF